MVTIDQYRGDAAELAEFATDVWRLSYRGKMTFPVWSAEYFRWQFGLDTHHPRTHLLAAYDGSRLAGVLLGTPLPMQAEGQSIAGSLWSWLSIHPDYRGQRLAARLNEQRVQRMREIGTRVIVSFRFFGSKYSQAERPAQNQDPRKQFLRKMGFWIRILDPVRMQSWDIKRLEGLIALLSYPIAGIPGPGCSRNFISPLAADDLSQSADLLQRTCVGMSLAVDWQAPRLQQQLLSSEISQSLVYREQGIVKGLVNFHLLPIFGRSEQRVGIFDIIAVDELPHLAQVQLINSAMARMRDQGAILALKLASADVPALAMLRTRWLPKSPDSHLVLQWTGEPLPVRPDLPMHLLWR